MKLLFTVLFSVILPSIHGLRCYSCSHSIGQQQDATCRDGTNTQTTIDGYPICAVYGYFDDQKSLLQLTRSTYETSDVPNANNDCVATDQNGVTMYRIICTCSTDNCNSFAINNCKCERNYILNAASRPQVRGILLAALATLTTTAWLS